MPGPEKQTTHSPHPHGMHDLVTAVYKVQGKWKQNQITNSTAPQLAPDRIFRNNEAAPAVLPGTNDGSSADCVGPLGMLAKAETWLAISLYLMRF